MSSLVELMEKLSTTCYDIESAHWVDVTHIITPDNFYVRPTAYRSHLPSLEAYNGPIESSRLKLRSIVVFKSQKKKRHIRGQICNIREENGKQMCELFSLDYGFMETVSSDHLKTPKRDGMPSLIANCGLADCLPKGLSFDKDSIDAMVFYIGDERAKMIIKGKTSSKLVVQLINTCPEDIATMMALTGYSTLGYGENVVSRMPGVDQPKLFYTYKKLNVDDSFRVRVQSGNSLQSFHVCDVDDYKDYIAGSSDFSMYIKREKEFCTEDFKTGMPVAVYNGFKYERAIINEVIVPEQKAVAQLVDWGKTIEIDFETSLLKPLPREYYFIMPALAIYCSAEEKQAWDNGLQRFLYPGYEFMITVKKVGKNLEKPNIVNISKLG